MRIRSVKPKFWRSDDIDQLTWDARLVFVGIWSYVDDNGVGIDKLSDIVADLFAHDLSVDPTETLMRVSTALDALSAGGLIQRYQADGKRYLFVTNWDGHQKVANPNQPRYPRPTCGSVEPNETLVRTHEGLGTGVVDKRIRGRGEEKSSAPRRSTATAIPDDWTPTDEHRTYAAEHGLDLTAETDAFKFHAHANDRRQVRWNSAFSGWLANSAKWSAGRKSAPTRGGTDERVAGHLALAHRLHDQQQQLTQRPNPFGEIA